MAKELWKDVKGYEGLYEVSNLGRVRSKTIKSWNGHVFFIKKGIIRKQRAEKRAGYLFLDLSKNGKLHRFYVHRLVAEAFLPNPKNLPQVNHKDENVKNNCVSNLEWCDARYNNLYGNRKNILHSIAKTPSKPVIQMSLNGRFIKYWHSQLEAARAVKRSATSISECCQGITKTSAGYKWRYASKKVWY